MEDTSGSVMIALLPITTDWCRIELPHLTLVYVGEIKDLKPTVFNELAKDASMLAMLSRPILLKVMGVEVFGDTERVNVLRLRPTPELWSMRRAVERWNGSKFSFNPHVTIGPMGTYTESPGYLSFDRIMVGWGDEKLTFSLQGSPSPY
jgi:2'-5' RNA ligase